MYTDETILTKGKYKFTMLSRVPPEYLLNLYAKNNRSNPELYEYVERNLELIKARANGFEVVPQLEMPCTKKMYHSENAAKAELKRIGEMQNDHKIPVRSYFCDKCGAYHLTSKPFKKS